MQGYQWDGVAFHSNLKAFPKHFGTWNGISLRPVFAEGEDLTVLLLPCSGYTYWGLVENKGEYYISTVGHKGHILYSFIPCYLIGLGQARVYIYRASIIVGLK